MYLEFCTIYGATMAPLASIWASSSYINIVLPLFHFTSQHTLRNLLLCSVEDHYFIRTGIQPQKLIPAFLDLFVRAFRRSI